tara:strand:+ start:26058 stop:27152 length:1095 start_codon:yes stop_codon:yes gene_type:complete
MKRHAFTLLVGLSCLLSGPVLSQEGSKPVIPSVSGQKPAIPVKPLYKGPLSQEQAEKLAQTVSQTEQQESQARQPVSPAPESVEDAYRRMFAAQQAKPVTETFLDKVAKTWKPTQKFKVRPKESIMIAVGQGLMNTISTDLPLINAKTNDETSTYESSEGYLYVTVNTDKPISLVAFAEGVLETQISITLVPIPAPPTFVEINFDLEPELRSEVQAYADEFELAEKIAAQTANSSPYTPYQQSITNLLLPVAQGEIPRGFGLTPDIPDQDKYPCATTMYHETKQRLVSGKYIIDVVHAVNNTPAAKEIREEMCIGRFVKAVALFQKSILQPGEESELYILRDKLEADKLKRKHSRPRLIGGYHE